MSSARLDFCTVSAARYACLHWHYARRYPTSRTVRVGVWENGSYRGCLIFCISSNKNIGNPYGARPDTVAELSRIALRQHETPVSRLIRIAISLLRRVCPGLRLLVSYADPEQGHVGGIYQAAGWVYAGMTKPTAEYRVGNRRMHGRAMRGTFGRGRDFPKIMGSSKYRYLLPLDASTKEVVRCFAQPYPKRERSAAGGAAGDQPAGGGSTPTRSLEAA